MRKKKSELGIIFGNNLKKRRQKRALTQRDIAKAMHVQTPTISKWENARNLPSLPDIDKLCKILKIKHQIELFVDTRIDRQVS